MIEAIEFRHGARVGFKILRGSEITIGRNPRNDWAIADGSVSRLHARIVWPERDPLPWLTDLGSSNGTFLNDLRLPPGESVALAKGPLRLGELEFTLERIESPRPPALLETGADRDTVVMFGDSKAGCAGTSKSWAEVQGLLTKLEEQRRSGMIAFSFRSKTIKVGLLLGSLGLSEGEGCSLLRELQAAGHVSYDYAPDLQLGAAFSQTCRPSELFPRVGRRYSQRRGQRVG